MKTKLLSAMAAMAFFCMPEVNYAQTIDLGTAANFVLFTSVGAVTNSSPSQLTGNVGSNSGSSTGFGNVNGGMNNNNGVSAQCATDLLTAYNELNTIIPTFFPAPLLGNGDTLLPGVYKIAAAATLNLHLYLNGQGDANAVFIFQVEGSLSTGAAAKVVLINSTLACNVYWKVEGLVSMAPGTSMKGTVIANNAAITMGANDTLEGRALSTTGAVSVGGVLAYTPIGCGSAELTGPAAPALASTACYGVFSGDGAVSNTGISHVTGDVGTNVGATTGFNALLVSGTIHPIPDVSTATCTADLGNVYTYLNALPTDIELLYPAQFGNGLVLTPHTYLMNAAVSLTDTVYLNALGDADAVFVINVIGAFSTSTFSYVKLINGTQAKNVYWKIDGALTINDHSVFNGTVVCNNAAVVLNTGVAVNGRVLATNGSVTTAAITVIANTSAATAGITGAGSVCVGSVITLADATTGGAWSSSNSKATVSGGVVTGVAAGTDTVSYIVTGACGADTVTKAVTISLPADAGTITGAATVCVGATVTLTDLTPGGTWTRSNASATVAGGVVTGVANGIDTIKYTITNGCGSAVATKTVTVTTAAGSISGPSGVCAGAAITLADGITGGTWTATNARATVVSGVVTGVTAGADTIKYAVTGTCGAGISTKVISVLPLPDAGSITGATSVCAGAAITLVDAAAGGLWSSGSTAATVSGGVTTGVTEGLATIQYVVTNTCGIATATKTITITTTPDAGTIAAPANVCVGSSVTMTDGVTGGTWMSSNANAIVDGAIVSGEVTGLSAGIDTISYITTNSCGNGVATAIIMVNALPVVPAITTRPAAIACLGTMYQNFGTATPPPAGIAYSWTAANATISTEGSQNQYALVNFTEAGLATVMLTVTNAGTGCTANSTVMVNVSSSTADVPEVNYTGTNFVCTPGTETSYQWGYDNVLTLDSTILSGEVSQDYANASPDFIHNKYWVITSNGGCMQKTYYRGAATAVQNINEPAGLSVYPDPASTNVNVSLTSAVLGNMQVVICNIFGQKMSTTEAIGNKAAINVAALPAGSYLITCYQNGAKTAQARFVKN